MDTFIVLTAKYLYMIILLIGVIIFLMQDKAGKIKLVKVSVIAGVIALALTMSISHIFYSARPFVTEHISPLFPHAPDNGFPSDHTLISALAAFAVYLVHKKAGVILGVLAIIVGASRVLAHVHHPIDIIGSLAIAGVAVLIAHYIIPKIPDKYLDFKHYFKK